ncbi:hypothetical protein Y1Q_0014021 [Alligator mississippiensis]|uniref:Endonuclease/exonuclease/phosphatase domain-containing protein n=1 Tax=Alligator mississippiensis TaxID=8496 RepID=A0A151PDF3_ALLMI|nr:hypothetical protein Y1Q_0014021 [Alligator mississippiensis]
MDNTSLRTTVTIRKKPSKERTIILGDFNARVGNDNLAWKGALGRHGLGNCNDNGFLLLEFCAEMQVTITKTQFQQKNHYKTFWMHPCSRHWHLIDYILVHQHDLGNVLHTRVMPSADYYTDN